jgi:hypothetical protein
LPSNDHSDTRAQFANLLIHSSHPGVKRFTRRFTENPCAAAVCFGVSEFQERFSAADPQSLENRISKKSRLDRSQAPHRRQSAAGRAKNGILVHRRERKFWSESTKLK